MFAPDGGASSTKFPAASVSVNAEPSVTVTPGIGRGSDSAVRMVPVSAGVCAARTSSVTDVVRRNVRPSTWASPLIVKRYAPGATLAATEKVANALPPGAMNVDERFVVIPLVAGDTLTLTRPAKLPLPLAWMLAAP